MMNHFKECLRRFIRQRGKLPRSCSIPACCQNAVRDCLKIAEPRSGAAEELHPLNIRQSQELITQILSGSFTKWQAQRFLQHALYDSDFVDFLQQVLQDIEVPSGPDKVRDESEPYGLQMLSNESLLHFIKTGKTDNSEPNVRKGHFFKTKPAAAGSCTGRRSRCCVYADHAAGIE
ncbi:MAG: hypothetical protein U5R06_04380 [candidate division KSB1 bacterium]|nr:hypothetical protein [candidate division KSB1 bacterium]